MRTIQREDFDGPCDAVDAGLAAALDLPLDALTTVERLDLLHRIERWRRLLPALEHSLIDELRHATPEELGGRLAWVLADRLHITRGEARGRIAHTEDLVERRTLDGQPLEPVLPHTATAQRSGAISPAHVEVIRTFWHHLPHKVDWEAAAEAERHLAELATRFRPDELKQLADRMTDCLDQDGEYSDAERSRRRGLVLGKQDSDGMSSLKGELTPLARAALDAVLARWAAPGMANPDDDTPCLDGTPSQEAIDNDRRSAAQRNHDALTALATAMLASGKLGDLNGLPASIVVTTTLADLEAAAGSEINTGAKAHTGGGTWMPMSEVIGLAARSHHYLAVFDGAKPLALYHGRRLANAAQRLLLYATERGCTHPGCPVPANLTEVHHITPYSRQPRTHADELTLRCRPHHRLLDDGWDTRKNGHDDVETIPPATLDHGQPRVNRYHHPEKLLYETGGGHPDDEDDEPS
ncbi:HNH endonuclease [Mycobacterium koreense]|uniref:Uncharacterized protein n=1 Tax=Mycolicibacillus koreensis TaxID=1069220 RepID=A0A7I7SG01_9MYCO|nr:HNH endonuclease signature motif containing protein [Mycolicibacillus koreensis]MCV7250494.1 HNH endonuclease [Mycolicibacillus koreensis]ODR05981.1 hypothetical protein BHQ15_14490 [Mycolicibacillus koreensis]OSC28349.1 hypothetical protein B8W67_17685 [Mycolicibacillus koreensis]BBY55738.1 hypothetical protein MKOR_29890 [Mycolicibacillus koreensis]